MLATTSAASWLNRERAAKDLFHLPARGWTAAAADKNAGEPSKSVLKNFLSTLENLCTETVQNTHLFAQLRLL